MTASLVEIGRIVKRHGVRGEVRVLPHNLGTRALDELPEVVLTGPDGSARRRRVTGARRHKRFVLLRFADVATANEADALVGLTVSVDAASLPEPEPGEVYYRDLLGCRVRTEAGGEIGDIREVFHTGSNDVCVVEGESGEHLLPLIADVVVAIDVERGEVVIRPIEGLLDR